MRPRARRLGQLRVDKPGRSAPVGRGVERVAPPGRGLPGEARGRLRARVQVLVEVVAVPCEGEAEHPIRRGGAPVRDDLPVRAEPSLDAGVGRQAPLGEILGRVNAAHKVVAELPSLSVPSHRGGPEQAEHVAGLSELAYDTRVNSAKTWSAMDAVVHWA